MNGENTVLEVRGLSKRFGGLTALSDVSFQVAQGELVALVGPNGAGKSTLFNTIAGVFPPTAGSILLGGVDVTGKSSHALARLGLARTFQLVTLFSGMTVRENVVQGLHRHTRMATLAGLLNLRTYREEQHAIEARADELLGLLGIAAHRHERAGELPLGIAKLLTVAIALATQPRLLLLDEPAAGLSHEESTRMMDLVATEVRKRCTVLLVEHNMRIVGRYCDRAVVLQFGSKIYDGPADGLVKDERVVDAYLGVAEMD
jgi:ABC-type branched-chain amino acid transport systems, ATPase component